MNFDLSAHARQEMTRRDIPLAIVEMILASPKQKVQEHGDVICHQSMAEINQKTYLVRVMVNETSVPPKVITVYRTNTIDKYWKATT